MGVDTISPKIHKWDPKEGNRRLNQSRKRVSLRPDITGIKPVGIHYRGITRHPLLPIIDKLVSVDPGNHVPDSPGS